MAGNGPPPPFLELSRRLAAKGIHIFFFTTPSNIHFPPLPQTLIPFLTFVPCDIPPIEGLPSNIENTVDIRSGDAGPLLSQAYAVFEHHLSFFLTDPRRPKPNWIIYDFMAASWAPALASRFDISCALFTHVSAAVLAFIGRRPSFNSPEDLTRVPEHVPFQTSVVFRPFEARQVFPILRMIAHHKEPSESRPQAFRHLRIVRTFENFEPRWMDLVCEIYKPSTPVVPIGFLPPSFHDPDPDPAWERIREWLDGKEEGSVVYCSFGSEVRLTEEQIAEIGAGLEGSGLAFLWALRTGSPQHGFEDRIEERGMVWKGWAPQQRVLRHPAVGGFLTHGGWNSVVEGMTTGAAMVVLPMVYEQGLNARHLVELGYAVEVLRNDADGGFSAEEIQEKLRMVMVMQEGDAVRRMAMKAKEVFESEEVQEEYVDRLVERLLE